MLLSGYANQLQTLAVLLQKNDYIFLLWQDTTPLLTYGTGEHSHRRCPRGLYTHRYEFERADNLGSLSCLPHHQATGSCPER